MIGRCPTDDERDGDGPDLEISFGGNGDWYVTIRYREELDGLIHLAPGVRFSTSGTRNSVATMLIAALYSAARRDWPICIRRCKAAAQLCEGER